MPRFFIDLHTGADHVRDNDGFELPDLDAVRRKVMRIMVSIVQDLSHDIDREDFVAGVRDETGAVVLRSRLSLTMETPD